MSSTANLRARPYGQAGDFQTVAAWWEHHRGQPLLETVLPPLGVIVEDDAGPIAAGWAYQSVGIGVAFFEYPVTRPGLALWHSIPVMAHLVGALKAALKPMGYSVFLAYARPPAARALERWFGFKSDGERELMVSRID